MNWRDPKKELPEDNAEVAILIYHWKNHWPQSIEIYFGVVESYINQDEGIRHVRVLNNDFIGGGSSQWYFHSTYRDPDIEAWCYADEFEKPKFLEHNLHWGPIKNRCK